MDSEMGVDLRNLSISTLKRYAWFFGISAGEREVSASLNSDRDALLALVEHHFKTGASDHDEMDEKKIISSFLAYCHNSHAPVRSIVTGKASAGMIFTPEGEAEQAAIEARKRANSVADGDHSGSKRARFAEIPEGRLVVSKIENEWILTRVVKHLKRRREYCVEDADEMARERATFDRPEDEVIMLPNQEEVDASSRIPPGSRILARYPGTTTFYDAVVVSFETDPDNLLFEYNVRFDDDERDSSGQTITKSVKPTEVVLAPFF